MSNQTGKQTGIITGERSSVWQPYHLLSGVVVSLEAGSYIECFPPSLFKDNNQLLSTVEITRCAIQRALILSKSEGG